MKNVIEFPKSKIVRDVAPFDDEEITKAKEKCRQRYADDMIEDFSAGMYEELEDCGLDTETLEFQKDFVYLTDTLRALIYRTMGIEHPLHSHIDERVKIKQLPVGASVEEVEEMIQSMIDEYEAEQAAKEPDNKE